MTAKNKLSIDCGELLDISHAAHVHQKLLTGIEKSSDIELQADKVTKVDTAGLQILVAFVKEIEKVSGSITWVKPSDSLKQAATTLGLTDYLHLEKHA